MGTSLLHPLACSVNGGENNPKDLLGPRGMAHGSSDAHFLRTNLAETFESQILESWWESGLQLWPSQFLSLLAGGPEAALQGNGKVITFIALKFLAFRYSWDTRPSVGPHPLAVSLWHPRHVEHGQMAPPCFESKVVEGTRLTSQNSVPGYIFPMHFFRCHLIRLSHKLSQNHIPALMAHDDIYFRQ